MIKYSSSNLESKLRESNGFLIARIGAVSHKRFVDVISKWNVGMYEQAVLTMLTEFNEEEITSQKELGELVGIDPRNLVPVIDSLEEQKFVERIPDLEDRRRSAIKLTKEGRSLAAKIRQAAWKLEREMFSSLADKEKEILHTLLLKLYDAVEQTGGKDESS